MTMLDLFSGIGGFSLAAHELGIKTTQFVEIDKFNQAILRERFPGVPIHADITTFTAKRGQFDAITAGFPCQDISFANANGRGLDGERSGLFFEVVRLIRAIRPRFVVLENVPALLTRGLDRVLWEITQSGYDAEWQVVSAASMGAPHRRERIFIFAYPYNDGQDSTEDGQSLGKRNDNCSSGQNQSEQFTRCPATSATLAPNPSSESSPDPHSKRSPWHQEDQERANKKDICGLSFWQRNEHPNPTIENGEKLNADFVEWMMGFPAGWTVLEAEVKGLNGKRLQSLGNAVTPQQAAVPLRRALRILV